MSLDYIRKHYKVPAYKRRLIKFEGRCGSIVGSKYNYIKVIFDDNKNITLPLHPTWKVEYL